MALGSVTISSEGICYYQVNHPCGSDPTPEHLATDEDKVVTSPQQCATGQDTIPKTPNDEEKRHDRVKWEACECPSLSDPLKEYSI